MVVAYALLELLEGRGGALGVLVGDGEADVVRALLAVALEDDVDVYPRAGHGVENAEGHAGLVGHADDGEAGDIVVLRYAAYLHLFHSLCDLLNFCAGLPHHAGKHLDYDAVALGELDGAVHEHLRAEARELEHLVVGYLVQLARPGDLPGVGGVDALDVGEYLAFVRVQHGGDGDGGGVRAAAAEGGDVVVAVDALEARDYDYAALIELAAYALGGDAHDARAAVGAVRLHAHLPAGERDDGQAHRLEGHGHERDALLLAGGEQYVHLALARARVELARLLYELVGGVALGGEDDDDVVALDVAVRDYPGHMADPVGVRDGAAAEFLYYEHGLYPSIDY